MQTVGTDQRACMLNICVHYISALSDESYVPQMLSTSITAHAAHDYYRSSWLQLKTKWKMKG